MNYGKVSTGKFAIFNDFSTYEIDTLCSQNGILGLINTSQNDFVCYPNLINMFYANLKGNFMKVEKEKYGVVLKEL